METKLTERRRPGARPKLDGRQEAYLIALACSTPPPWRERWTMQLSTERVVEVGLVDSISIDRWLIMSSILSLSNFSTSPLLYARSIPPVGGHNEFADMRTAYDALLQMKNRRSKISSRNSRSRTHAPGSVFLVSQRRKMRSCHRCHSAWSGHCRRMSVSHCISPHTSDPL